MMLNVDVTRFKPSDIVSVTRKVPTSAIPGDIVIINPARVTGNVAAVESEIVTVAPSGSVAAGRVYVEVNPALMVWSIGAVANAGGKFAIIILKGNTTAGLIPSEIDTDTGQVAASKVNAGEI